MALFVDEMISQFFLGAMSSGVPESNEHVMDPRTI